MYSFIKQYVSNIYIVSDPLVEGSKYFVKTSLEDREINSLRIVSNLELPETVRDTVYIPHLVSEDPRVLPPEITFDDSKHIAIVEAARGEDLKGYQFGASGTSEISISIRDFEHFKVAIRFLNENGVVHGDLRNAENIFVRSVGGATRFDLIDWGGPFAGMPESDEANLTLLEEDLGNDGILLPEPPSAKPILSSKGFGEPQP